MMYYVFKYDDGVSGLMLLSEKRVLEKCNEDSVSPPCRILDTNGRGAYVRHVELLDVANLTNERDGVRTMKNILSSIHTRIERSDDIQDWGHNLIDYFEGCTNWGRAIFDLQDAIWDFEDGITDKVVWSK